LLGRSGPGIEGLGAAEVNCETAECVHLVPEPETPVRFEAFTAGTMKNAVFWDIKPQFVLHRRHYFSATEFSQLMLCKI
jgi:hypothetical protein